MRRALLVSTVAWLLAGAGLDAQSPAAGVAAAAPAEPTPWHVALTLASHRLGEQRTINVYTPPGYASSPRTTYPVLYMLDGGLAEDFPHVVNTIDSLIALGAIPPVLVVGIQNTERRRDLTGPTVVASDSAIAPRVGGSAAFRAFIRDELMPEIRSRYRCSGETAVVGESLAGLFIVETLLLEPSLFHRYIALSPSVWWNGGTLVRDAGTRVSAVAAAGPTLFLASANEEQIVEGTASLAATLRTAAPAITLYFEPRPDLEHGTIFRAMAPGAFVRILR